MGRVGRRLRQIQGERSLVVYRADEPCLAYQCPTCEQTTVTVVIGTGTPPPAVRCLTTPGCTGHAVTDYARHVPDRPARWEWYRPGTTVVAAARAQGGALAAHVDAGGMLLRHRHQILDQLDQLAEAAADAGQPETETSPCP